MQTFRDLRKLPREIWILAFVTLINRMGTMALPFLALYLNQRLGFSIRSAGFVVGLYGIGALVISPIGGWLCDRFGGIHILLWSLLSSAISMLLYPAAQHFWWLFMMTLLWAITSEAGRTGNLTIIGEFSSPAQRRSAFAVYRLAINLGMSIGPAVGGWLASFSLPSLFFVDGLTTFLAGIVLWITFLRRLPIDKQATAATAHPQSGFHDFKTALTDQRLLWFLMGCLAMGILFFQHESTLPIFLVRNLSLPEYVYGLMFTVNTILIVFLEVPLNLKISHWSHRKNFVLGSLLFAFAFGAFIFAKEILGVMAIVIVWTFGEMILFPTLSAYVSEIAPPRKQGSYMGLYSTSFSLSFILGPWIGSFVLESFGATALWGMTFLFGIAATLFFLKTPKFHH